MTFRLANRMQAKVENTGGEHGIGFSGVEDIHHVIQIARAATGDDGDTDRRRNCGGELDVITGLRPVRPNPCW